MPVKTTPPAARRYLFWAVVLIALPSIVSFYHGHKDKLLVATAQAKGTIFENSVIYLTRHDFWGAHGVIINKPVKPEDFKESFPELSWNVDFYNGGPVRWGRDQHHILLEGQDTASGIQIVPLEYLRREYPELLNALEEKQNTQRFRFYVGYAGWGMMQLNREIVRGGWKVIEYDDDLMLKTSPAEIWDKAMEKALAENPDIAGQI